VYGWTILSKFVLPKATQTSERANGRLSLVSWRGGCQKWTRLGADKGNDLGAAKCYVIGEHGRSRDEVPNYYVCENRILEPSVKSRARKKYHLSAGTNTVKFVYLGAPVPREKSWCPYLKSGARRAHRAKAIVVLSPAEEVGAFSSENSSHYADIRSGCIR